MGGGSAWVFKNMPGEQNLRGEGGTLALSAHEWVWQEGTRGGQ